MSDTIGLRNMFIIAGGDAEVFNERLAAHDAAVRAEGVAEGIRRARAAVEAARPTTYDLNWAWQAIAALEA